MAQLWTIVGGTETGGILVRDGQGLKSTALEERLSSGAQVEELEKVGDRLKYRLKTGKGPVEGWISVKISGKDLAVPLGTVAAAADSANVPAIGAALAPVVVRAADAPAEGPAAIWAALLDRASRAPPITSTLKDAKPWLVPAKPGANKPPARLRLVFFDWTGNRGGAGAMNAKQHFERWLAEASPKDTWEVCKVEYPGRGMRPKEPNAVSATEVAVAIVDALGKAGPMVGTVLFGVSFGAVLAYETAALMSAAGQPPLGLVVASAEHPLWPGRVDGAGKAYGPTKDMDQAKFEALLREKRGVPEMIMQMPSALGAIRADMELEESYGAKLASHPPLPCPILAFRGRACPQIVAQDVQPWLQCSALASGPVTRVVELETGLKPTSEQHWLSDWYLCQSEVSGQAIMKAIAEDFGRAS